MEVEDFLSHHGVKGQKWGVRLKKRRIRQQQKHVDRFKRVSRGTNTKTDAFIVSMNLPLYRIASEGGIRGASKKTLSIQKENQRRVKAGEAKVLSLLAKFYSYEIRDLKY